MTAHPVFAEGALTIEQWQQLESLARTLSPPQARWISGYFAGLDAGLSRSGLADAPPAPGAAASSLTILYGSETGNGRNLGKALGAAAEAQGLTVRLHDMADYKVRQLKDEKDVLIIVSTHGEGDPPQPALAFFEHVEGKRAPRLETTRFAVLGLGDSTYEKFCEAGKRLDRRLEELGATRLQDRLDCDIDYDDPAAEWIGTAVALLAAETAQGRDAPRSAASFAVAAPSSSWDKSNPFPATIIENIGIVARQSTKETRHLELDLAGSGLVYEPGDAIGVAATNDPASVAQLIECLKLDGDAAVTVKGTSRSLHDVLKQVYEIGTASPRFLKQWAAICGAAELEALTAEDRGADRSRFLHDHHVIDIVRRFPAGECSAEDLLAGLRPLQPRLYSIASSLSAMPDEAHLTLSPVRYSLHGEPRCGVASGLLADRLEIGSTLPVHIQSNPHFRLPADDTPIVMIGAGTGVAPYRAFLQEREARSASGRSWLFFGERNFRSDFLYQTEWQAWMKDGLLSRMDVAFSRDGADRVYVQHRMLEQAADLYAWIQEGAHIYVCGDAAAMAPDVNETLIRILGEQGRLDREGAVGRLNQLVADQRYQRDVY